MNVMLFLFLLHPSNSLILFRFKKNIYIKLNKNVFRIIKLNINRDTQLIRISPVDLFTQLFIIL